ncbi:MAG TPA: hypothetical protein VN764_01145 [Polyangiaceae bacterium]|nr:hypothetical protein [Polyangiaceae bacterium]
MHILYKLLLVIHISAAALTLGSTTGLLRLLRRGLDAGQAAFALAAEDGARRGKITGMSSMATLWTGLSLIFVIGGFKVAPLNIHIALSLMLVAVVVSFTLMRPSMGRILALSSAAPLDVAAVRGHMKKLAMGQGILHLLWLCILVLMLVRIEK